MSESILASLEVERNVLIFPSFSALHDRQRLAAIGYALERGMELCCTWVVSTPETVAKIQLGKELWYFATSCTLLRRRLEEMKLPHHRDEATPAVANDVFISFTNALFELQDTRLRMRVLHEVYIAGLLATVREHKTAVLSVVDRPTWDLLREVEQRLEDQVVWYREWLLKQPEMTWTSDQLISWPASGMLASEAAPGGRTTSEVRGLVPTPAREASITVTSDRTKARKANPAAFMHEIVFSIEICGLEMCARNIVLFRDMPWAFKMDMARQAWDEARHAEAFLRASIALGGSIGMDPVNLFLWQMFELGENLAERLMIEQRLGEGRGLDIGFVTYMKVLFEGDEVMSKIFDYLICDELGHVGRGNYWIRYLSNGDDAAINALEEKVWAKLREAKLSWMPPPVWKAGRAAAGFTEEEITNHMEHRMRMLEERR